MSNELNIALTTGRTITARLILDGAYVGSAITCTEAPASSGHYSGSVPGATGAGHYSVLFLEGATIVGTGSLLWDGTSERTALDLPTTTAFEARTLPNGDYFNPATDAVATVTTVTNAVTLPSIPANWITAAGVAADAVSEIQSGLATAGDVSAILEDTGTTLPGLIADVPTVAELNARTLPSADYFVVSDYTAPPTATANATAVRTELSTELGRIDTTISSRSTYDGSDTPGTVTLVSRLTSTRAGYLDKLNVSGTLAHSDAAATYRADISGLLTTTTYTASLPTNFADLSITATTGLVTSTNAGTGATAAEVWGYTGRTLDGTQATALTSIEGYTRPMAKQLGLVAGVSATHAEAGITVSDGDGSTTITDNNDGTYTVEGA